MNKNNANRSTNLRRVNYTECIKHLIKRSNPQTEDKMEEHKYKPDKKPFQKHYKKPDKSNIIPVQNVRVDDSLRVNEPKTNGEFYSRRVINSQLECISADIPFPLWIQVLMACDNCSSEDDKEQVYRDVIEYCKKSTFKKDGVNTLFDPERLDKEWRGLKSRKPGQSKHGMGTLRYLADNKDNLTDYHGNPVGNGEGTDRYNEAIRNTRKRYKNMRELAKEWVLLDDGNRAKYYNIVTGQYMTRTTFNSYFSDVPPKDANGLRVSVQTWIKQNPEVIQVITGTEYNPTVKEAIFNSKNKYTKKLLVANLFRRDDYYDIASEITPEGEINFDWWYKHFVALLGPERAKILMDYAAFCRQNPGVKVPFMFILQGVHGCGKTLICRFFKLILGEDNYREVTPRSFNSQFNQGFENVIFCSLEEMYLHIVDKQIDPMAEFKNLISSDTIEINPKGKDSRIILNFVNFIGTTNTTNSHVFANTERRVCFYKCRAQTLKDLNDMIKENSPDGTALTYWDNLGKVFKSRDLQRQFKKIMSDWVISDYFRSLTRAPEDDSVSILQSRATQIKGYQDILDVINDPKHNRVANHSFIFTPMINTLAFDPKHGKDKNNEPSNQQKNAIYRAMGYSKIKENVCIKIKAGNTTYEKVVTAWAKYEDGKGYYNELTNQHYSDGNSCFDSFKKDARSYFEEYYATKNKNSNGE